LAEEKANYRPARVDEDFVLRKCEYFAKVGLWSRRSRIRPKPWLQNFEGEEREYAVSLLNAFLYFSDDLMLELFRGAFHGLSRTFFAGRSDRVSAWRDFAERVVFTPVHADGGPAESGIGWVSRWKHDVRVDDSRTMWPEEALTALVSDPSLPVVFIDDFVGSGRQMRTMWEREIPLVRHGARTYSFREVAASSEVTLIYSPALCTHEGMGALRRHCADLYINPGNEITPQHNALASDSLIWPSEHLDGARDFVEAASARAGIPGEDWEGFEKLGLAIGFAQSVPDATLPLIYWEEEGWQPLIQRS
jgi:hypothetical protein